MMAMTLMMLIDSKQRKSNPQDSIDIIINYAEVSLISKM